MSAANISELLVAYTATATGRDALKLATVLAKTTGAHLSLTTVVPESNAFAAVYPKDKGHLPIVRDQVRGWLEDARESLPEGLACSIHTVHETSDAKGILAAANERQSDAIVVGSRGGGWLSRYRLGSTANTLLHSSRVPVILAPAGYENEQPLTRITALFRKRDSATNVISAALELAVTYDLPLRLVSLVTASEKTSEDAQAVQETQDFAEEEVARLINEAAVSDSMADRITTLVVTGRGIEDAVTQVPWEDTEVAMLGSSSLAAPNRLFLGSTASRLLRHLSTPTIIIPAPDNPPR